MQKKLQPDVGETGNDKMNTKIKLIATALFMAHSVFAESQSHKPPGVVIAHISQQEGRYIGSPSICVLPDGTYIASHDEFGPKSTETTCATTRVYRSTDKGASWQPLSRLEGQFWSSLFTANGSLYIIGTNKAHGDIVIRRSDDGGMSWTTPQDSTTGVLLSGEYHTAPVPLVAHGGRIWRAVEHATFSDTRWPQRYGAMMISAKMGGDLLNAATWKATNVIRGDSTWLRKRFKGWLEGNAIVTPDGKLANMLRIEAPDSTAEYAAIARVDDGGENITFNPDSDFVKMPGGGKKFTIRYDSLTKRYWTLSNPQYLQVPRWNRYSVRNMLVLCSSTDLRQWTSHEMILFYPERWHNAFQYVDWLFEGDDMICVSRTAFADDTGGANSFHNSNYMTFHRIKNFRALSEHTLDYTRYITNKDE